MRYLPLLVIPLILIACGERASSEASYVCSDGNARFVNKTDNTISIKDSGGEVLLAERAPGLYTGINGNTLIWRDVDSARGVYSNQSGSFSVTCENR